MLTHEKSHILTVANSSTKDVTLTNQNTIYEANESTKAGEQPYKHNKIRRWKKHIHVRRSIAWQCLCSAVYDAKYTYNVKLVFIQHHCKTNMWGNRTQKFVCGHGRKSVTCSITTDGRKEGRNERRKGNIESSKSRNCYRNISRLTTQRVTWK
jgi:hypothetical protein